MIRVLVADDHAIVREGVKNILNTAPDIQVVCDADDGHAVLAAIQEQEVDVVLLDISMPGLPGLDTLKRIKESKSRLPVLMLSVHPEELYAVRSLKAGASGYLTKASVPEELIDAVREAYKGGKYITKALACLLAESVTSASDRPPHETLSDREYQVLRLIAKGNTVSAIAEQLALSVKTVSTYRVRILDKMNMKTNAELTYYAVENGLV